MTQRTLRIVPLHDELVGGAGRALPVLLGAVAFVLLIACANAANLLLARASARQREIAVRMAVGAARGRLLRQLLVESVVLAGIGGAAGLLLANAAVAGLLHIAAQAIPRLAETTLDRWVLVAAFGISAGTALLSGLAPALALRKTNPHDALQSGVSTSPSAADGRLRRVLVAGEIALALVLLAAGLAERLLAHERPRRELLAADRRVGERRRRLRVELPHERHFEDLRENAIDQARRRRSQGLRLSADVVRDQADSNADASLARRFETDPIGRRQISDNGPLLSIVGPETPPADEWQRGFTLWCWRNGPSALGRGNRRYRDSHVPRRQPIPAVGRTAQRTQSILAGGRNGRGRDRHRPTARSLEPVTRTHLRSLRSLR